MPNCYTTEYLTEWDIKTEMVNSRKEANNLKKEWSNLGFTVASKSYNFFGDTRITVAGIRDKTNTKTKDEIKKEVRQHL